MPIQWRILRQLWTRSRPITRVPCQPPLTGYYRQASNYSPSSTSGSRRHIILSSLGLAAALHYSATSTKRVYCRHTSTDRHSTSSNLTSHLPSLTIYEYPSCPFCGKVKAFLDFYNIDYTAVTVNPVSRKEIEFSKTKKLPLVIVGGEKVQYFLNIIFSLLFSTFFRFRSQVLLLVFLRQAWNVV